jgi:iron complex outermembrane receptor protein
MHRSSQQFRLSTMSASVLFALACMASQANAQDQAGGEALDAKAITQQVTINGSNVANRAPVLASLKATEPQSIITATFIEQVVTPLDDFNAVARIAPSVGAGVSANGPGLGETKVTLRGFQDGEYNMTYDGIPFGDTNNPTHHSTSYFPARIIGGMVIERGPGNASNVGQATFGGSINLFSKELSADRHFSPYATVGSFGTRMLGAQVDSGVLESMGGASMMFNASHLTSDGYLSLSAVKEDNYQFKYQLPMGRDTKLTVFSTYNKIHSNVPDKAGVTLSQVAQFGKNYSLNNDPTSQNYYLYNYNDKRTDFDYVRVESTLAGWTIDNTLYTYSYDNNTFSGQDASGATANGTKSGAAGNKNVPGYNKLNSYRTNGDILKLNTRFEAGLLRTGIWLENSHSNRHTYDLDYTLNVPNPKEATAPKDVSYEQGSSWKQYQPFVEFEWALAPALTVTPGLKQVHFTRALAASVNQGTRLPTVADATYTTTLPFLTANYSIDKQWSAYAQTARGFLVPDLSTFYVNNPANSHPKPQTSTNYQLGTVHQSQDLTLDADLYYIDFNNKLATSGSGNDQVYFNQGGVVYKGIEGAATYYVGEGLSVHANGSVNSAKTKDTKLTIAKVPNATTALGLLYKSGGASGSLIAKRTGSQFAKEGEPAAYKLGAYTTTDLAFGYRWRLAGSVLKSVKLQGGVSNVFNKQDATSITASSKNAAFDQYTFIPERSYTASVSADF